jgi:hypothetical protein
MKAFGCVRINGDRTTESEQGGGGGRESRGRPLTGKARGAGDTSWRAGGPAGERGRKILASVLIFLAFWVYGSLRGN